MAKPIDKKFGWVIKNFTSLQSEICFSVPVLINDCKWRLLAYPKGNNCEYLSLYLQVVDFESLPCGWGRYVKVRLTIVNQLLKNCSVVEETEHCFDAKSTTWGFSRLLSLTKLHEEDSGFLVNGEVMIFAELDFFEVVATLDASEKFEESVGAGSNDLLKPVKEINEIKQESFITSMEKHEESFITSMEKHEESIPLRKIEVNGFLVLPSQVQSVMQIFERHPDIAVEFRAKNQHLRTTFMHFLLSLIETLYQPLQELSNEDLVESDIAVTYLKDVGFKVDWLQKKLDQLKEKKEKERSCEARVQELEAQLHDLTHKYEMEKAELSDTRVPLSFDDFV